MKKQIVVLSTAIVIFLTICFCSCGGQTDEEMIPEVETDSGFYMSQELYESIQNEDWVHMKVEDFNSFFGFEGVLDITDTENYGKKYQVYRYYGMTEDSYLTIVFKDKDGTNEYTAADMKPSNLK